MKYWRLHPEYCSPAPPTPLGSQAVETTGPATPSGSKWDAAIEGADLQFSREEHNLLTNNCHHHVADALSRMRYLRRPRWNQFDVWLGCLTKGKYVSTSALLITWSGWIVIAFVILIYLFLGKQKI
eukprot:GHVN01063573.1.p1 GENE.GHVN01063573.1~~GHVN01063573.1.p1  ORF type:complete len:148 (+),score=13.41 GHVN01063573.1:68-445(+)